MKFENHVEKCVVKILDSKNKTSGTGFWVSSEGYLLTCYHVIKSNAIKNIPINIEYKDTTLPAHFENEFSSESADIAVLSVPITEELQIEFVPLVSGQIDFDLKARVFGYRQEFGTKGYTITGTIRPGQTSDKIGKLWNFETNQPDKSSVGGMSGAPVYDPKNKVVVGIQYGEEKQGPSISYVHPIEKAFEAWPELFEINKSEVEDHYGELLSAFDLQQFSGHFQYIKELFLVRMGNDQQIDYDKALARYQTLIFQKIPWNRHKDVKPCPLADYIDQKMNRILVIGDSGGGKTSSLLRLGLTYIDQMHNSQQGYIPVFVQLNSYHPNPKQSPLDHLITMLGIKVGLTRDEMKNLWLKSKKPLLFLLDGLNEVDKDYLESCMLAIQELSSIDLHAYLVASRPGISLVGLSKQSRGFESLEINQLNSDQVLNILKSYNLSEVYEKLNDSLKTLCQNPFMLWALTQSWNPKEGVQPSNRGKLYDYFIDQTIFKKRELEKIPSPTKYNYGLVKRPILTRLGFEMTRKGITKLLEDTALQFSIRDQLLHILKKYKTGKYRGLVETKSYDLMPTTPIVSSFLDELILNGIFKRSDSSIGFFHQSVQDYFTALALLELNASDVIKKIQPISWSKIEEFEFDSGSFVKKYPRSFLFEAIIMMSGLASDRSKLLESILSLDPFLAANCYLEIDNISSDVEDRLINEWLELLKQWDERKRWIGCLCVSTSRIYKDTIFHSLLTLIDNEQDTDVLNEAVRALRLLDPKHPRLESIEKDLAQKIATGLINRFGSPSIKLPTGKLVVGFSINSMLQTIQDNPKVWTLKRLIETLSLDPLDFQEAYLIVFNSINGLIDKIELNKIISNTNISAKANLAARYSLQSFGKTSLSDDLINLIKELISIENLQSAATIVIRIFDQDQTFKQFMELLKSSEEEERVQGAIGLGVIRSNQAVDSLLNTLNSDSEHVRLSSADALIKIRDEESKEPLKKALVDIAYNSEDLSLRERSAKLLYKVPGGHDLIYYPILKEIAKGNYKKVINIIGEDELFLPSFKNLYVWRSLAFSGNGNYNKSLEDIELFFNTAKEISTFHYLHKGVVLYQLGRINDAVDTVQKGIDLSSNKFQIFDSCYYLLTLEILENAKIAYSLARNLNKEEIQKITDSAQKLSDSTFKSVMDVGDILGDYNKLFFEEHIKQLDRLTKSKKHLTKEINEIKFILTSVTTQVK